MQKHYYVYILANSRRTIYIGFTNDLQRRLQEHRDKVIEGYTSRYNLTKLVYYEVFATAREAIAHEKRLKGWLRAKKVALIESKNPNWQDLSDLELGDERRVIHPLLYSG